MIDLADEKLLVGPGEKLDEIRFGDGGVGVAFKLDNKPVDAVEFAHKLNCRHKL